MKINRKMWCAVAALCSVAAGSTAGAAVELGQILPLGDSITYGNTSGSTFYAGGYRTEFYNRLTTDGYSFQFVGSVNDNPSQTLTTANQTAQEGHPGYAVDNLTPNLVAGDDYLNGDGGSRAAIYPDAVLLDAGINNFLYNYGEYETVGRMDSLLSTLYAARPTTHVYLAELIPYTGDADPSFYVEDKVLQFDGITAPNPAATGPANLPELVAKYDALGYDVTLVDTYDAFVNADGSPNTSLMSADGTHPNDMGYTVLGDVFADAVESSNPIPQTATVPEPASVGLVTAGTALLALRRRRR